MLCFFRDHLTETPTYTGGVNQQAREIIDSRSKKKDGHGLYISSMEGGKHIQKRLLL